MTRPETSIYILELPSNYKIHLIFYARLLKAAIPNDLELFSARELIRPSLAFKDDEKKYKIENILNYKKVRDKRKYLVY
jgi:hypothetical protein